MMKILETIILGVIQGIAEFLPISSSAHLIIFRDIFGIASFIANDYELCFDIALHFGTLLAILVYFFKDFWKMIVNGFTKGINNKDGKLLWLIVTATIPAAIIGVLLEDVVNNVIRGKYVIIILALVIMGIIINFADKKSKSERSLEDITFKDAILIGLAQACAIIPGFSRSGTTIATARLLKIDRSSAAKFSFYLSAPVVCGAVAIKLLDGEMLSLITYDLTTFILGVSISFIAGILCIRFLLQYIKNHDYSIFMWYRFVIAIITLVVLLLK